MANAVTQRQRISYQKCTGRSAIHSLVSCVTSSMSMDEWRITKTTIETEMLRLADLLSVPVRGMHPALARHEAEASNHTLHAALKAVSDHR